MLVLNEKNVYLHCPKFKDNEFSIYHFTHDTDEKEDDYNDDTSRSTNNNSTDGTFHISTNDTKCCKYHMLTYLTPMYNETHIHTLE